jgi:Zn-dependent protease
VETRIVLYSPVTGSITRFFWRFAFQERRVERKEWLRVLPKTVFLPVLTHTRAITVGAEYVDKRAWSREENIFFEAYIGKSPHSPYSFRQIFRYFMNFLRPTYIIAILIAISVHEWAHAISADKLGDRTARNEGRLTLNPIAHIDLLGAILFVTVGFGWAKPVPVNPMYFKHPKRDMAITAIAGPFSNLILAIISFSILILLPGGFDLSVNQLLDAQGGSAALTVFTMILRDSLFVNLALMAFNLFPIAPLDGSNILRMFIPLRMEERYDDFLRIGPWILLGLLLFESFLPFPLLSAWVHGIMQAVLGVFASVAGLIF